MKMKLMSLLNHKGSALLFTVIAITSIAVLGTGIYFMTTTSTFSGISANDQNRAYQLAVVVDDAAQGINAVVRGVDLLASTPRQIWLQQCLGLPTPSYAHLPVVVNTAGEKLSKQTRAAAVDSAQGSKVLAVALELLGHPVPAELRGVPLNEFWGWAIASWSMARVPAVRSLPQPGSAS